METAYDLKALVESLKKDGLDLAEEGVKKVIVKTFAWVRESAKLSPNTFDDIAVVTGVLDKVESLALGLADKVDGEAG